MPTPALVVLVTVAVAAVVALVVMAVVLVRHVRELAERVGAIRTRLQPELIRLQDEAAVVEEQLGRLSGSTADPQPGNRPPDDRDAESDQASGQG